MSNRGSVVSQPCLFCADRQPFFPRQAFRGGRTQLGLVVALNLNCQQAEEEEGGNNINLLQLIARVQHSTGKRPPRYTSSNLCQVEPFFRNLLLTNGIGAIFQLTTTSLGGACSKWIVSRATRRPMRQIGEFTI
jgi:hypothetical protein